MIFARRFGGANVTSLQERKSRFLMLISNEDKRAATVGKGIGGVLATFPERARNSITFDRGTEFMSYRSPPLPAWFCESTQSLAKGWRRECERPVASLLAVGERVGRSLTGRPDATGGEAQRGAAVSAIGHPPRRSLRHFQRSDGLNSVRGDPSGHWWRRWPRQFFLRRAPASRPSPPATRYAAAGLDPGPPRRGGSWCHRRTALSATVRRSGVPSEGDAWL